MGSQRTDQGSIIGREGLLRLVEGVERLAAREGGRGGSQVAGAGGPPQAPGGVARRRGGDWRGRDRWGAVHGLGVSGGRGVRAGGGAAGRGPPAGAGGES